MIRVHLSRHTRRLSEQHSQRPRNSNREPRDRAERRMPKATNVGQEGGSQESGSQRKNQRAFLDFALLASRRGAGSVVLYDV